jgi:hypothetical protein
MAYVTPRMSLKVWNSSSDPYDHEQLADNLLKLDSHDHTESRGTQIPTGGLADGSVTVAKANLPSYHITDVYSNRPPATTALNGVRFYATDKRMEWQVVAGAWSLLNVFAPEVTSLPTTPVDQQECVYIVDATAGLKWRFRYRAASASAYKWEAVGAGPLINEVLSSSAGTPPATYGDLSNVGPQITLPLAGDYLVSHGANLVAGASAVQHRMYQSFAVGATAASDNDAVSVYSYTNNAITSASVARTVKKSGLAANTSLVCKYYSSSPLATEGASLRYIQAAPVRVG